MTETFHAEKRRSVFERSFFLTGPTASGKTALGVALANALDAEILSLDSMAIYRRMDIGTAKPTIEERCGVPHHMFDLVDPDREFSLMQYLETAEKIVDDVHSRGKKTLFVGGTPLYLKAILFGVFEAPQADPEMRDALRRLEESAPGSLWKELQRVDPVAAKRLHPNDTKRLVRAIEVFRLTGSPISALQTQFEATPLVDPARALILTWPRETLYERIGLRVRQMLRDGFLEEVRALENSGTPLGPTASKAVGYREMAAVLRGEQSLEDAVEKISQCTRNFAKRQETWFRSLEKIGARRLDSAGKNLEELRDEALRAFYALEK